MASSRLKGKFLLAALIFAFQTTAFSQSQQRVVDKLSWQSEPVKIQKIKANGINVETGKRFRAEKDWLNGLTVSVQNISNKAIARIEINLNFPRPANAAPDASTYVVPMVYGLDPADSNFSSQLSLLPGATAEVKLPQANLPIIKEDLATLHYPEDVTHVRLTLSSVTFIDGSMWAGDEILYPDPANPKQKINPRLKDGPTIEKAVRMWRLQNELPGAFRALFSHASAWTVQDPTAPCNTVFVSTQSTDCGTSGSGCFIKTNVFDDSIHLLGLRNAIKQLSSTRCQKSDGTFCTSTIISNFDRLPCGAKVAGTCGGAPDYTTYPTTGCATGFTVIGGVCSRSLQFQSRCGGGGYDPETCTCPDGVDTSPIVIDIDHSGFSLTDAFDGVSFDILGDGVQLPIAWTDAASTNSFLVLDRDRNGTIDNGQELFGNLTPQPASSSPNGFLALAEFDKEVNGGNGDHRIDGADSVFTALRLWRDANHNGQSEATELRPLAGLIRAIDLNYKESKRVDEYGNTFRYRAKVYDANGVHGGRWAWDVFLTVQ